MANSNDFVETLRRYFAARIPVVVVRSAERNRVRDLMTKVVASANTTVYWHAPSLGLRDLVTDASLSEEPSVFGALEIASQNFRTSNSGVFVFSDVQDLETDSVMSRHALDVTNVAAQHNGTIVLITDDPVWPRIQRLGMAVVLDTPDSAEMEALVRSTFAKYQDHVPIGWTEQNYAQAGRALEGVTLIEAENLIANLIVYGFDKGGIDAEALAHLTSSKDQMFSDLAGIERVEIRDMPGVGGLDELRRWLDEERPFLTHDYSDRHIRSPRGVMLVGVPGCGKSLSAKQIAASWERPLYRLDLATVLGRFVGESEAQLRQALETAERVAPCILWIDEIEKALGSSSSDSSGVTQRLIGQFLFWLQESTSPVFVVATANDVSSLPPELMRKGRFDELFSIDLPSDFERREIVDIHWGRYLPAWPLAEDQAQRLVHLSDGYSGAEIESCIKTVAKHDIRAEHAGASIDWTDVETHFTEFVPMSQTSPEQIAAIREWGRDRARPATSLRGVAAGLGQHRRAS